MNRIGLIDGDGDGMESFDGGGGDCNVFEMVNIVVLTSAMSTGDLVEDADKGGSKLIEEFTGGIWGGFGKY